MIIGTTWIQYIKQNPDCGLRIVVRNETFYGKKYVFNDIYSGEKLIAIE